MSRVRDTVAFVAFCVVLAFAVHVLTSCLRNDYATSALAAEAAYTADLTRCVDKSTTLAESKACRREVDARWGITEVPKEAGR